MSKIIKINEADIKRIVEQVLNETNGVSDIEEPNDLNATNDDDTSSCTSKYTVGKDEQGHYYIIDLLKNQIIAKK